jgi:YYY domain-containing protein
MALPYTLVALALAWNVAMRPVTDRAWWLRMAFTGAAAGALFVMNSWDLPLYLALAAAASWYGSEGRTRLLAPVVTVLVAVLAWLPFYATYATPTASTFSPDAGPSLPIMTKLASTVGAHLGERTSPGEYLTIFGIPFALGIALVVAGYWQEDSPPLRMLFIASVATIIPGVLLTAPILPLCGIPLTLALAQLKSATPVPPRLFALVAFSAAWAISIGVEFFYIRDAFDSRMNTLFKFYYQTWTLYAVAAAITVPILWQLLRERCRAQWLLTSYVALALVLGITYPSVASYQWTNGFTAWQGLDGLAYGDASDRDDVAAIRWLREHAAPGDVVLEAAGCSYRPFGRVPFNRFAAFTGIPTIIGWGDNHERQWRAGQPDLIAQIAQRQSDVAAMYQDPESPLFDSYGVRWLVVGQYERNNWQGECPTAGPYPGIDAPAYPGPGWQEAFRAGNTVIYERASR